MFKVAHSRDLTIGSSRTVRFEGEPYGSGVSFFLVDNDPGAGRRAVGCASAPTR